jgi:hypothetical protein
MEMALPSLSSCLQIDGKRTEISIGPQKKVSSDRKG